MLTEKSSSTIWNEDNKYEEDDDDDDDNVIKIDQKQNFPINEYASHLFSSCATNMNDNQNHENKEYDQSQLLSTSFLMTTKPKILTEIDENDFFYENTNRYTNVIDKNSISDQSRISSYIIIEEDNNDEPDHVKELEKTIANLSRHIPNTSSPMNNIERNIDQSLISLTDKIDTNSVLEMEIESSSTDQQTIHLNSTSCVHIPISMSQSINHHRNSLSRSLAIRENLTNLLTSPMETMMITESSHSNNSPLQRINSDHSQVFLLIRFSS